MKNLPLQKAAGPQETTYEHIKYAGIKGQQIIRQFLNKYLKLQKIPTD